MSIIIPNLDTVRLFKPVLAITKSQAPCLLNYNSTHLDNDLCMHTTGCHNCILSVYHMERGLALLLDKGIIDKGDIFAFALSGIKTHFEEYIIDVHTQYKDKAY